MKSSWPGEYPQTFNELSKLLQSFPVGRIWWGKFQQYKRVVWALEKKVKGLEAEIESYKTAELARFSEGK